MKTAPRDFIENCLETLSARMTFLMEQIASSDRELHFFKRELKTLEYAATLMRHELQLSRAIETELERRRQKLINENPPEGMNV